jgi:hypothetical protein
MDTVLVSELGATGGFLLPMSILPVCAMSNFRGSRHTAHIKTHPTIATAVASECGNMSLKHFHRVQIYLTETSATNVIISKKILETCGVCPFSAAE